MKKQIKLCVVSPLFHPNIGGPGRQAYSMADKLGKIGVELIVITRELDIKAAEINDIKICYVKTLFPKRYNLSEFTLLNFLVSLSFSLGAMFKLASLRNNFEIVQFYGASLPLLICLPLLKLFRKKIVVKLSGARRGMEVGNLNGTILGYLLLSIFSFVDRFIVMSEEMKQRVLMEKLPEANVIKIPNGVDVKVFCPYDSEKRDRLRKVFGLTGKKVFIYSGRLIEGKGLDYLLDAMKLIISEVKASYLILLGDGPIADNLSYKASSLGISENIHFKGNVDDVNEYLNASDVFIFPSFSEGMPNSLLEAMACGLPAVASRIGGVVDIVEDGRSGMLFKPGDVSGLASAMFKLLRGDELSLRLGNEARKRIVENFSIDRIADEYIKLYNEL